MVVAQVATKVAKLEGTVARVVARVEDTADMSERLATREGVSRVEWVEATKVGDSAAHRALARAGGSVVPWGDLRWVG